MLGTAGRVLGLYLGGLKIHVEGADASGGGGGPGGSPDGGLATPGGRGPGRAGRGTPGGGPANPGGPDEGGVGNPDAPGTTGGPKSLLKLERKGRIILLNLDLNLNERATIAFTP